MRLLGLSALELGATLLACAAAILLLYLLRRPARQVVVPALSLWRALVPEKKRLSARFQRLRGSLSLLLALAIAALLAFALSDPERGAARARRNLLLLIDRSASMAASDLGPSRLERAKAEARALVRGLRAGDHASIAALDGSATPLTGFSGERAELLAAIERVTQSDGAADLLAGARLARDLLAARENPELVLFSDGSLSEREAARRELAAEPAIAARHVSIGQSGRNVGIANFSLRRYPRDKTHHESLLALTNFGGEEEPLRLEIRAGGELLYEERFTLAPGTSEARTIGDLPGDGQLLEAKIALARGQDALASDDRALALLPPRVRTRVLSVSPGDRYLEAALLLDESLSVDEIAPEAYRDARGYDLVIFDRSLPKEPPAVPALYLGPGAAPAPGPGSPAGAFPLASEGFVERPFFERVDKDHPLLAGLALADVNVARALRVRLAPGDRALAAHDAHTPLIIEGARDQVPFLALSFGLGDSDLPLRPAWPLFLLRALDRLAGEVSPPVAPRVAGEPFALALDTPATRAELVAPDGRREALPVLAGSVRVWCERAGAYRLEAEGLRQVFTVQLPSGEGAIAPSAQLFGSARRAPAAEPRERALEGRIWPLLALLALALLTFEWLSFHRRWTV